MNRIAFIQARMGSTRLPGKIMKNLFGVPMLARVVSRVLQANTLDQVVVVTSTTESDQAVVSFCQTNGWPVFCGSEDDVLDRYYQAALTYRADIVVRITADCPLIEPDIIDEMVKKLEDQVDLDYVNNRLPPITFPRGMEMDVLRFQTLADAWMQDENPSWREHVTPYIYNHPEKFKIYTCKNDPDHSHLIWTVDIPEDLEFIRKIYDHFKTDHFSYQDIIAVLESHPDWLEINRDSKVRSLPYIF